MKRADNYCLSDRQALPPVQHSVINLWLCKFCLLFSDLTAFALAKLFSGFLIGSVIKPPVEIDAAYHWLAAVVVSRWPLYLLGVLWIWFVYRHYTYRKPLLDHARDLMRIIFVLAIVDLATLALLNVEFSREKWAILWFSTLCLIPCCRALTRSLLNRLDIWAWPSVIVGCGNNAHEAFLALAGERTMGYRVDAFFAPDHRCSKSPIDGVPLILGRKEDFVAHASSIQYFLALEYEQSELRDNWIRFLAQRSIRNVVVIPAVRGVPLLGTDISHLFSHEVLMLRLHNKLARLSSRIVKRMLDIVVVVFASIALAPLMAYIAYKISRDGGNPIYGHVRIGQNGKSFKCLKFRSMVYNSQEVLDELLSTDPIARAEWEKDFKLKNDPRITKIGQFIRKTSLDELPQLWNVLKGEMSLVGPRPVIAEELSRYGDDKEYYLMAKPGVTGLWQVSGRNDVDYATRVYLDSWYVKNWSVWYDLSIIFKTVSVVLKRDGAY